jgi:hypothetical protein
MNQGLIMVNPRYRELRLAGRIQHTNFAPSWAPRQPEAWRSGPAEWRQWYERSICIQIIRTHIQEMVRFIYVFIKGPKVFFILHIDVWSKPLFRNQRKSNAYDIYVYVCVCLHFFQYHPTWGCNGTSWACILGPVSSKRHKFEPCLEVAMVFLGDAWTQ